MLRRRRYRLTLFVLPPEPPALPPHPPPVDFSEYCPGDTIEAVRPREEGLS